LADRAQASARAAVAELFHSDDDCVTVDSASEWQTESTSRRASECPVHEHQPVRCDRLSGH